MGYYTVFRMGDVDPPEMAPTIKARLCELSGYGSPFGEDHNPDDDTDLSPPWVKWYAWREHCLQVSVENLWVTFTVHGAGEDGSRWASTWSSADEVSHVVEQAGDEDDDISTDDQSGSITFANGVTARLYSGPEPESFRGPSSGAVDAELDRINFGEWGPSVFERAWPVLAEATAPRLGVPHDPVIDGAWVTDGTTDAVDALRADIVQMGRRPGKTALGAARAGLLSPESRIPSSDAWAGKSNSEILADIAALVETVSAATEGHHRATGIRMTPEQHARARAAGAVFKRHQASARKWWRG